MHTLAVLAALLSASFESEPPGAPAGLPVGVSGLVTFIVVPVSVMVVGPSYRHPFAAAWLASPELSVGIGSIGTGLVHEVELGCPEQSCTYACCVSAVCTVLNVGLPHTQMVSLTYRFPVKESAEMKSTFRQLLPRLSPFCQ